MNVQQEINQLLSLIREHGKRIRWLRKHRAKLEALPEARMYGLRVDFDNLPHAQVVQVVRELGGKWNKTPAAYANEGKVNYNATVDGVEVCCYAGAPPPSCRIVEVEEVVPAVPATVRKVKKMVCKPEFAAEIAIAAEKGVQP